MKLSMEDISLINALNQVTGVSPKDCLVEGQLISYLIPDALMGKAIGKAATNVKMLEQKLNKRVEMVAYLEKPEDLFAKALEVEIVTARTSNGQVIVLLDAANKAKTYKNSSRLRRVRELIKRNFNLELVIN